MSQLYKIKKVLEGLVIQRAGDTGTIILQKDGGFVADGDCREILEVGYFWRALRQRIRDRAMSSYPEKT